MFCFRSSQEQMECKNCIIRKDGMFKEIPEIDKHKNELSIFFGNRVTAGEFAIYFGELQKRILDLNAEQIININLEKTKYINQFCISKLILTISLVKKDKCINIFFPHQHDDNKMLRFLYNNGILDLLFTDSNINCYINNEKVNHYEVKYNFSNCYDQAIFPYRIYVYNTKIKAEHKEIEKIITDILHTTEDFYVKREQQEKFHQIKERLHLYLYEIIDNIFQHAYEDYPIIFGINICNSYLPPYKVLAGTREEKKFANRIARLQKEVPMSVYKDIHDRFFGGFNVFVDDIGKGISSTYSSSSIENVYRDVYINGSKKRKNINGLKLVADQIAINNDILWAHDRRHWVCTSFVENNSIIKSDKSETLTYKHTDIRGLTYDIFINLAQNSKEKIIAYNKFGYKVQFKLSEIRDIISLDSDEYIPDIFVDLINIKNKTKKFNLNIESEVLFYRFRAIQKNKIAAELDTRIQKPLREEKNTGKFKYLVVYDLNQTTLFQARAVFENKDKVKELIKKGIEQIVLITEECWFFVMDLIKDAYYMHKNGFEKFCKKISPANVLKNIFTNDRKVLYEILTDERYDFIYTGTIYWGNIIIREYWDIEQMLYDRAIADLIFRSTIRISGLLDSKSKIVFFERFMDKQLGSLVNEYKNDAQKNIFLGSVLMSGETEGRLTHEDEWKIYFFRHKECAFQEQENHIILFNLPTKKNTKKKGIYKRIPFTNHIEACDDKNAELLYYSGEKYEQLLKRINYSTGFYSTGFISVHYDQQLLDAYLEFVVDMIRVKLMTLNYIDVLIELDLDSEVQKVFEKRIVDLQYENENRSLGKKVTINQHSSLTELTVELKKSFSLIEIIGTLKKSSYNRIFLPIFNNIRFEQDFNNIITLGYIPFIPLYCSTEDPMVGQSGLEKFSSFTRTLNPKYRKVLESSSGEKELIQLNLDWKNDIIHYIESEDENERIHILKDTVLHMVGKEIALETYSIIMHQYQYFIKMLLFQHSIRNYNITARTQILSEILSFYEKNKNILGDSIIIYLSLVIVKSLVFDYKMLEKFYEKKVGIQLLKSKSMQLRVLFADLFSENCRPAYETLLNDIFVSNDITIYYNMLAQLLFNSHGVIHESELYRIIKNLDEKRSNITDQDIYNIQNIVPNCISLLKMTKSYNESIKKEEDIEKNFYLYSKDIRMNLDKIETIMEEIYSEAKKRFVFIDKEDALNGIHDYVDSIIQVLEKKDYSMDYEDLSNLNARISNDCKTDKNGFLTRNINMYNDTIIFEELAYLLHNSHFHSYGKFSIDGNGDSQYKVWMRAELHNDSLVIRLFNCIKKKNNGFEEIVRSIQEKKRVGKTYLEKFSIHVSYHIPEDVITSEKSDIDIFETKIEIPYFN